MVTDLLICDSLIAHMKICFVFTFHLDHARYTRGLPHRSGHEV